MLYSENSQPGAVDDGQLALVRERVVYALAVGADGEPMGLMVHVVDFETVCARWRDHKTPLGQPFGGVAVALQRKISSRRLGRGKVTSWPGT